MYVILPILNDSGYFIFSIFIVPDLTKEQKMKQNVKHVF